MYPRRHDAPQGQTGQVTPVKAQGFKVRQGRTYWLPGFEGFCGGSWWDVDILKELNKSYLVKYMSSSAGADQSWLPLHHLRLRTRRADDWDCHILKRGMDISVSGMHSDREDLVLHPKGLYDARIVQLSKVAHEMKCTCRFHVNLYCVRDEEDPCLVRKLQAHSSASREVDISNVSILQQPTKLTFEEILRSHMLEEWLSIKWGNDAYFLRETKLTISDDETDDSMGPAPSYVATWSYKVGGSLRPSRGSASVLHDTDTNATCKNKDYAYARHSIDEKHKVDAANKATHAFTHDGHDSESDVRATCEIPPHRFEEFNVDFDNSDQHGARAGGGRKGAPERAVETDYDISRGGLGVGCGGRSYDKSRKENEEYGVNAPFERGNHEDFVVRRPDYFERFGAKSRHENLDVEATRKLDRGNSIGVKSRRIVLDAEDNAKFVHQNQVETSRDVDRGATKCGDDVLGPLRKKQESCHCRNGRGHDGLQKEEDSRKRYKSEIFTDTSSAEEGSENVVVNSVSSDESSVQSKTKRRKRTKPSRNRKDEPEVIVKPSGDREERLRRRNTRRMTRSRDETHSKIDRGNEDDGFQACEAQELHHSSKHESDVKAGNSSPPKKNDTISARPNDELERQDKQSSAKKASLLVRRRGRPRKDDIKPILKPTCTNKGKATPKEERKKSASPKDAPARRKAGRELKDSEPKAESLAKTKPSEVINLEDDDRDEIEDDGPPIKKREGRGIPHTRGEREKLRERRRKESTDRKKAVPDTNFSTRLLRSRKIEKKKKKLTKGNSVASKQPDPEVQGFSQRPLYLDVLGDNPLEEAQIQDGADVEKQSQQHGCNLHSNPDPTNSNDSKTMLEENNAVVNLPSGRIMSSECQVSTVDRTMGTPSWFQTGGLRVEPFLMEKRRETLGEAVAERTSVDHDNNNIPEATTVLDSADKMGESHASEKNEDVEKLNSKFDSQD